jgi:phospho-N-acetylmuramoyl-pentapeptide-transferase
MLLFLIHYLQHYLGLKLPAVFTYSSTRMACSAITSLLVTLIFGKKFIKKLYEWKVGDKVRSEDCPLLGKLHQNKNDTPTMGGILIIFSLLVSLFLWMDLQSAFTLLLFVTTVVIGILGGLDDYLKLRYKNKKGISAKKKLAIQGLFSCAVAIYLLWPPAAEALHFGNWFAPPHAKDNLLELPASAYVARLYIPFCKHYAIQFSGIGMVLVALFICCVITGASNAVNLTDGLDGLATGTIMLASSSFALIAFFTNNFDLSYYLNILYLEGSSEIAVYLAAVSGACLGFLWYNGHPAQVFMGDTGSLTLGGILGVSAVLLKRELLLGIIGGVFVIEALSVIVQVASYKLRNRRRVFLCAPLHHHFEYKGWPETKVVIRFWIVGLLLAIIGIASLKFQ